MLVSWALIEHAVIVYILLLVLLLIASLRGFNISYVSIIDFVINYHFAVLCGPLLLHFHVVLLHLFPMIRILVYRLAID